WNLGGQLAGGRNGVDIDAAARGDSQVDLTGHALHGRTALTERADAKVARARYDPRRAVDRLRCHVGRDATRRERPGHMRQSHVAADGLNIGVALDLTRDEQGS